MATYAKTLRRVRSISEGEHGDGVSEDTIASVERALGHALVGEYRRFLGDVGWCSVGPHEVFGLGTGIESHLELTRIVPEEWAAGLPKNLIPIWNNGGGDLACLDTSASGEPPVVMWYHDDDDDPEVESTSFVQWLSMTMDEI